MPPEAYAPLKALSDATNTPMRTLMAEAVALLLLERSADVPTTLRAKVRGDILGLD
jgi:hypothetical protein